jgi:exoribonuclease II
MVVIKPGCLALYKNQPARVLTVGDRVEIELTGGERVRVRLKDIFVLHPGPLVNLKELVHIQGDVRTAWEILAGGKITLEELAELAYGEFSPSSAWSAWQCIAEQVYFTGSPVDIRVYSAEEVEQKQKERAQAEAEQQAWKSFIDRVQHRTVGPADHDYLIDVENLAYRRSSHSRVLHVLGRAESAESAHSLLLDLGVWNELVNPYPIREGVVLQQVDLPVPSLPKEDRLDLTHLQAFAIDDEGTDTPDDALSLDGERIWVHVADVSALVHPDSAIDLEARSRGMSLHLPEGTIHLLPRDVTLRLGLGLQEISPALSFGFIIDSNGQVTDFSVSPSWIRVERLNYAQAEPMVDEEPLSTINQLLGAVRERRMLNHALMLDFPEVKLTVDGGQVEVQPILPFRSRAIVEEAMILTGAETARYAAERGIILPFSQQDKVETSERPGTLSGMFALRRLLKRSHFSSSPGPHNGLGIPAYSQVTSPLRRYLDLVAHQQLRAALSGLKCFDQDQVNARIAATEVIFDSVRQAELLSEQHWTLVYLLQHPGWRGEGILVNRHNASGTLILPGLALEARVHLKQNWPLDQVLPVILTGVDLSQREARFRILD